MPADARPYRFSLRAANALASILVIGLTLASYYLAPHFQPYLARTYQVFGQAFSGAAFLSTCAAGYALLLLGLYFFEPDPRLSKSVYALRALARLARAPGWVVRDGLPDLYRLGLLATLLKAFFAPLMLIWLLGHVESMLAAGSALLGTGERLWTDALAAFNSHGFWFLLYLLIFADVFFFTIGYLVEHPVFGNEIRSVDPTLLGWAAALACYPPFNEAASFVLGWHASDFPRFDDATTHVVLNLLLLAFMAVYASASVALNFKASNLTHRGIVDRGPYALVRHPAYVCKNLAWWIGAIPAVQAAAQISAWQAVLGIASVVGWSMVYVLRAVTEEDHLRRVDGAYDAYMARVRYRFVPGVW